MNDPSHYQQAADAGPKRRGLPRARWVTAFVVVAALVVVVLILAGGDGHDPSQMNHG